MSSHPVQVYVYDLSHGMMAAMSQQFLGKKLDGLWHTGIHVYGKEYFFGGGIQSTAPGMSPAGRPHRIVDIGNTEVPLWMFEQYLEGISSQYTQETYNLLSNNCNNFTDDCAKFLTGKGAPSYVTELPSEFMNTPLGTLMTPLIDTFFKNMGGAAAPVGGNLGSRPAGGTQGGSWPSDGAGHRLGGGFGLD
eukprot:m.57976 g.57976  ORF g.57976 m.57976 type:complete len:191 (-) comp15634_c0_seq1:49-621(-)